MSSGSSSGSVVENATGTPGDLAPPEGNEWFQVQKRVRKRDAEGKDKLGWTSVEVQTAPGVMSTRIACAPQLFADGGATLRRTVFENFGAGTYRLRYQDRSFSTHFTLADPETAPPAPPGLGGTPRSVSPPQQTINAATGRSEVATPADALALLPRDVQQFVAMQSVMRSLTSDDLAKQAEASRQHFELMLRMVDRGQAAQGGGGGGEVAELRAKIALLETVNPLRAEIAALRAEVARSRSQDDDDDDDDDTNDDAMDAALTAVARMMGIDESLVPIAKVVLPPLLAPVIPAVQQKIAEFMASRTNGKPPAPPPTQ